VTGYLAVERSTPCNKLSTVLPAKEVIVKRIASLSLVMIALALVPSIPAAQTYPSKPIRILVAWPAGGPADLRARQIAAKLSQAVGQPVVVENRPGASGTIGAVAAAKGGPRRLYGLLRNRI
jgi:tripartite-type tricarboxylate transporter receptor subunit TctC